MNIVRERQESRQGLASTLDELYEDADLIARGLDAAKLDPDMLNGRRILLPTPSLAIASMQAVGLQAERLEGGRFIANIARRAIGSFL
jgi:hypothetical protein